MTSNIILIGMTGCGKTTIGKELGRCTDYAYIDLDHYLEEKSGQSIPELFTVSENHFRALETEACKDMLHYTHTIISTGGGVVTREINRKLLKKSGTVFWIDRPIDAIMKDIDVSNRPLLSSGKEQITDLFEKRKHIYQSTADYVIKNDKTLEDAVDQLLKYMHSEQLGSGKDEHLDNTWS